jgi:hypothetical protein
VENTAVENTRPEFCREGACPLSLQDFDSMFKANWERGQAPSLQNTIIPIIKAFPTASINIYKCRVTLVLNF